LENVDDATLWERWWNFSLTYLNLVWIGMVFAFMMAGITESFIFPGSLRERFDGQGFKGVLKGAVIGPVMALCSACIVPVATAFRRRGAGIETTVAITQGSSTMNLPALIMASMVFIPLIGGSRIALSIVGTLLLGPIVARVVGAIATKNIDPSDVAVGDQPVDDVSWKYSLGTASIQFLRATVRQAIRLGPIMIIAGFVSGFAIQWISPQAVTNWIGDDILGILIAATLGIAINVPLMFEIPLVAAMLLAGMGTAPAGALLFTAAAGGPITYWGLSKVMPTRGVVTLAIATWTLGVIGGVLLLAITAFTEEDREFAFRADYTKTDRPDVVLPAPSIGGKTVAELWGHHLSENNVQVKPVTNVNKDMDQLRQIQSLDIGGVGLSANSNQVVLYLRVGPVSEGEPADAPRIIFQADVNQTGEVDAIAADEPSISKDDKGNYWEYRFDLGAAPRIDRIIIAWPSGIEQIIFDPPTGQSITVHNPPQ